MSGLGDTEETSSINGPNALGHCQERSRQARLDEINKARGRWLRYKQMESIQIAKSASELSDIYSSFSAEDDKARNEAMIDQIRVRIHVYAT